MFEKVWNFFGNYLRIPGIFFSILFSFILLKEEIRKRKKNSKINFYSRMKHNKIKLLLYTHNSPFQHQFHACMLRLVYTSRSREKSERDIRIKKNMFSF
jgi:hypothetical protein